VGLPEPFTIATDHRNLEYWTKACNLNRQQAWWYLTLVEYNFTLVHKLGSSMIVSDLMSQDSAKQVMDAEDNWDVVMLKSEHF
jgi:putative alpha-1,2-mannosidase